VNPFTSERRSTLLERAKDGLAACRGTNCHGEPVAHVTKPLNYKLMVPGTVKLLLNWVGR
jgi:hypothetical protein